MKTTARRKLKRSDVSCSGNPDSHCETAVYEPYCYCNDGFKEDEFLRCVKILTPKTITVLRDICENGSGEEEPFFHENQ